MNDETKAITIDDCIKTASQSPLAISNDCVEFDRNLHFLYQERDDPWLKAAVPRYLAQAFMNMIASAQKAGISAQEIEVAIRVELERHEKAIREYVPVTRDGTEQAGVRNDP
jgi:hypothetical protein